jgi:dipeptidyl aminopeptidase/acylaminoacyl peptidase
MPAFPRNRIWLSSMLSDPTFDAGGASVFAVRSADARRAIIRLWLDSGLMQTVTAEPSPGGTVGYGGGAYDVRQNLLVYASEGRLIAIDLATGAQRTLTPTYEGAAAPAISPCGRFVAFVIEGDGHAEVLLTGTQGDALPIKLSSSPDFAANPTFAPDGTRVAWIEWRTGRMPWEESRIRIARFAQPTGTADAAWSLLPLETTAIERTDVSYANPQWGPGGTFAYTSDESGWRSLYVAQPDGTEPVHIDTGTGEIGLPDWIQGQFAVRWGADDRFIYAARRYRSRTDLLRVNVADRSCEVLPSEYTLIGQVAVHPAQQDQLAYIASSPSSPSVLVTRTDSEMMRATTAVGLTPQDALARAEIVQWPTADGSTVYGVLYRASTGEGPRPTLVSVHGGPTSETPLAWSAEGHYWAGQGWHVLYVNHRGGTGNGRQFQDMLNERWGVIDVEDARSGAEYLVAEGLADSKRLVITGGSAGGYTTLMAMVRDPDFWTAGVSLFGIGHQYEVRLGSHRFEARYEDTLIGLLPDTAERWVERSPLFEVHKVKAPVLLFHGKEDNVIPYQQSVDFADKVRAQGGIAEVVLYDDEGHGFRREKNRRDCLDKTEAFLDRYVINLQFRR